MDTDREYSIVKSIVQSGLTDKQWDKIRNRKGSWPKTARLEWRQYRKYNLDKLLLMMDTYKANKQSKELFEVYR